PIRWPDNFPATHFPVGMVEKYRAQLAAQRVLTMDQWGDYLIFRSYPQQKVFVDGRSDFYGQDLGKEYLQMSQGGHPWRTLLEKYKFDMVLAPVEWPLAELLKTQADWKILADDGKAVLFARR
ncbi:MAG: hypothetical protein HYS04_14215, partial [Acidobacteria bacterium]|nr:hypothetical protein [Acidobacteriota bacterium]